MKFAHMADLHLGGWRDPELEKMNKDAFGKALDKCVAEKVDFILVSGDFFDTSMPPFDILDFVSKRLNDLKKAGIPVYTISGSHDYSPSGKTILKVLENAELIVNVATDETPGDKLKLTFTTDRKTGAKITGIFGKKGSLDEELYKNLDKSIETDGYKIFLFHSGIQEYLPDYLKEAKAMPLSLLPKGFNYYAGGHIHHRSEQDYGKGKIVFPGPLFPCNFQELERFKAGGFYIVENGRPKFVELKEHDVKVVRIDAENKAATDVESELGSAISSLNGDDFILLIKVSGTLKDGRTSDINFRRISEAALGKGAIVVRRNTNALSSREYEEVKVSTDTIEHLEERIIKEHLGRSKMKGEKELIERLMRVLDTERMEGETTAAFEGRVLTDSDKSIADLNKASN